MNYSIIFQIFAVLISTYIAFVRSKKIVYVLTFLFNLSCLLVYYFNNDLVTSLMYLIIAIRSFVYIYKDKINYNFIPLLFILLHLIVWVLVPHTSISILSVLTPCFVTYYMWYWNTLQKLRIGNIINNGLWFIYNLITGVWILMVFRLVVVIANILAYKINFKKINVNIN